MVHGQSETMTDRNSSRVLAPPGGASSMGGIFGGPAPEPVRTAAPRAPVTNTSSDVTFGARVAMRTEHTGISGNGGVNSSRVLAAPGGNSDMASLLSMGASAAPVPVQQAAPVAPAVATPAAPQQLAAGQRIAVRTEHTGITEHASSRVLAVPGGQSNMASILGGCTVDDRKAALMARRAQVGQENVAAP